MHPGLEAIFNMVLAWSALYIGFSSDGIGRNRKSMVPTLLGAQFLTNALFLPYLVQRESGGAHNVEEVDVENDVMKAGTASSRIKALPLVLSAVFSISIFWFFCGRLEYYPADARFDSLTDLLSNDRLGFSFCVDLVYFWLFQGG